MKHKDTLDIFLQLVRRPHPHCLQQQQPSPANTFISNRIRRVSTTPTPKQSPPKKISPPSSSNDPKLTSSSSTASRVPLHIGLDRNTSGVSAISRIPIPKGERGEEFTPSTLARPLGLTYPPQPGQNTPFDTRPWSLRKTDYESRDSILARRQVYLRSYFRPYFQEWGRLKYHSGKSFVANDKLFKREKALYFPNIWGKTLSSEESESPEGGQDTTTVLRGMVSVVAMQAGRWAENQVGTFLSSKSNPGLERLLEENRGRLQRVDVNMQGDVARGWLVKLFQPSLRKHIPEDRWGRYFMVKLPRDVRRGLTEEIRDAMGLLNSSVGYVYLVDSDCRIRWAGSGDAWDGEVAGMNGAIQRLLREEEYLKGQGLLKENEVSRSSARSMADVSAAGRAGVETPKRDVLVN